METTAIPLLARTGVDMAGHRRTDTEWLAAAWADPTTRVLVLEGGDPASYGWKALLARQSQALVRDGAGGPQLVYTAPAEAPEGERYLLGTDDGGRAYFAVLAGDAPFEGRTGGGVRAAGLREVGPLLDDRESGLLVHAVALANWNASHRFCPGCGAPTRPAAAGHVRICEREGTEQFPRMDPAVIMLVHRTRADGEQECLLGHNPAWPEGRYSVLAGFVEPGESLEHAVVREVAEEVGVAVAEPAYTASQPWPFPRSLMLGFTARAVGPAERTDADEITDVRWFTRAQLSAAAASGEIALPTPVSIAHTLIEQWHGAPLPEPLETF
ncbi:NAD(+) diphosphatase [Nocardiopsis coralliicola]